MILIAEDNIGMRRMIRNLVEDLDPDVVECSDGQQAIIAYEKYRPDLVLMDINMRPIDGLTASREILCRDANARIIIVTQQQDARTRETALAIGVEAFIGKDDLMSLPELIRNETTKSTEKDD